MVQYEGDEAAFIVLVLSYAPMADGLTAEKIYQELGRDVPMERAYTILNILDYEEYLSRDGDVYKLTGKPVPQTRRTIDI